MAWHYNCNYIVPVAKKYKYYISMIVYEYACLKKLILYITFTLSMLQSKILSTVEAAYGFHPSSGSYLLR